MRSKFIKDNNSDPCIFVLVSLVIIQAVLLFLKIIGFIKWSFTVVFIPTLIPFIFIMFMLLILAMILIHDILSDWFDYRFRHIRRNGHDKNGSDFNSK